MVAGVGRVTVIVAVSPVFAWVVSSSSVPLGLVVVKRRRRDRQRIDRLRMLAGRGVVHDRDLGHLAERGRAGEQLAEDRVAVAELRVERARC